MSAGGLIAYVLADEDRTRRARSLLYPVALILLTAAAIVIHSPIAGAAVSLPAAIAGLVRWRRRNRGDETIAA
jgi:hypothetical protein